ncbi:MAG: conjugative transposon protein TraN [Sphingobacteriales bacterium]|jgi:conjugative transposon TraN protein|nr:MAG: conjugative transposon protein TraN [Sphingobacteriales bacterium]
MKRIVSLICTVGIFVSAIAQTSLCITTDKTTSLVFPFAIRHVDRGTRDVLVQPVKELPNVLLVKAGAKDFPETNLSVITEDGNVYSFLVCYNFNPSEWVYYLPANKKATLATYANAILDNTRTIHGINDKECDMLAIIKGIYIKSDVVYYQLQLKNESPIDYDIDLLRFYITDKRKSKRTAVQENELKPLYIAGNISQVKAFSNSVIVIALDKFTIPDAKYLAVQVMEKNGGRHFLLKVHNNDIMKARVLPDLK